MVSLIKLREQHKSPTGKNLRLKRLLEFVPKELQTKLLNLCDTLPLGLASYVVDNGFPLCAVCNKEVKKNTV